MICLAFMIGAVSEVPAHGGGKVTKSGAQATASIMIDAAPKFVWNAIHVEREHDPDIGYSKVIENTGNIKLLEQKFVNVPIFGSVIAITRQVEEPDHRIAYSLVRSDKFKALSGSWDLSPLSDGKRTMLTLRSNLNIGIPFSSHVMKATAQKKIEGRLQGIKQLAETEQNAFAARR